MLWSASLLPPHRRLFSEEMAAAAVVVVERHSKVWNAMANGQVYERREVALRARGQDVWQRWQHSARSKQFARRHRLSLDEVRGGRRSRFLPKAKHDHFLLLSLEDRNIGNIYFECTDTGTKTVRYAKVRMCEGVSVASRSNMVNISEALRNKVNRRKQILK